MSSPAAWIFKKTSTLDIEWPCRLPENLHRDFNIALVMVITTFMRVVPSQLYLAFKTDDVNLAIDRVASRMSAISCWMEKTDLKLNPEKREADLKLRAQFLPELYDTRSNLKCIDNKLRKFKFF